MDEELENRLAKVVERLLRSPQGPETERDRARRQTRERVLAELPRLESRIISVMAEFNDTLAATDMGLRMTKSNHTPVAEAVYTVEASGLAGAEPVLVLIAEAQGRVRAMLERDHHRALVDTVDIFDLDKARLAGLVLTMLEAHAGR
ncbi:MAG TPA: hypothetical protein VGG92_05780 [Caulobacteraceae bacterium]|jgi:hypothetical protein